MSPVMKLLTKVGTLDRRVIFGVMGLAIVLPILFPLGLPFKVSKEVRQIYEAVEALPPGSRVLIASDFDPGSKPELDPFLRASLIHLFRKDGVKVVVSSLWPPGPPLVESALADLAGDKVYGEDYANLGFKEGKHLVILAMAENMRRTYPADNRGNNIDELPVMNGVDSLKDFDLILSISAGTPGTKEWVQLVQNRYGLKMAASCTAVSAPDYIPYYQSGQLLGLAGGMAGSAEYEKLVGINGPATAGMDVLSMGHLLIVLAVILGNISYFMTSRKRKRRAGGRV